jgi:hypothetical protein
MTNQQHQPFDDDPELYDDDPEMQGGTTHGQDEADDLSTLLDDEPGTGESDPRSPRTDRSAEDRQPEDEDL